VLPLQLAQDPHFIADNRMGGRRALLEPPNVQDGVGEIDLIPTQVYKLGTTADATISAGLGIGSPPNDDVDDEDARFLAGHPSHSVTLRPTSETSWLADLARALAWPSGCNPGPHRPVPHHGKT
jgi:hypothetical protein